MNKYYFKDFYTSKSFIIEAIDKKAAMMKIFSYILSEENIDKNWKKLEETFDVELIDLNGLSVL